MNRSEFVRAIAAAGIVPHGLRNAPDQDDPATVSQAQSLRVLLGRGSARTLDASTILFEGRRYRGSYSSTSDGQIVNLVPLEQYLYSVVPREMPHSWPAAALQAQAILARTYVLQRSNPVREYDLVPSEADQVYTGLDAEHPETSDAVDITAGQALRFGNGFAEVLYSSCCGGHTESNANAWGGKLLEYLSGVTCTYCTQSPWYSWTKTVALTQASAQLREIDAAGNLQSVTLDAPDSSGRPLTWTFVGTGGAVQIKAKDVRRLLGTRTLPSLLVRRVIVRADAAQASTALTIEGGGLGHGVGLCQWGARGMALTGASVRAILSYYYPGTGTGND